MRGMRSLLVRERERTMEKQSQKTTTSTTSRRRRQRQRYNDAGYQQFLDASKKLAVPSLPRQLQEKRLLLSQQRGMLQSQLSSLVMNDVTPPATPRQQQGGRRERQRHTSLIAQDDEELSSSETKSVYDTGRSYEEMESFGFPSKALRREFRTILKSRNPPPDTGIPDIISVLFPAMKQHDVSSSGAESPTTVLWAP